MGEPRYVMLMASLPYHGRLFGARQTPLSRFQLDKRLAWLEPEDADTLLRIEDVLRWRRLALQETDAEFLERAEQVIESLGNSLLADVVRSRLEARTLIAALRRRHAGRAAPGPREPWGFSRWLDVIVNNWQQPDFGLSRVYPWLVDANSKLEQDDAIGLDRVFMDHAWRQLARIGAGHYFDFEAVAIYVLRWDLIDRWTHYDNEGARDRIIQLTESSLGDFRHLFATGAAAA